MVTGGRLFADRYEMLEQLPKDGVVAELGTYRGDFARAIIERAAPRQLHLIDIDFSHFDATGLTGERVTRHRGLTVDVITSFPDSAFDWIYIDADHSYAAVAADIRAAACKIRPGGFLVFNDFAHIDPLLGRYGVHRAVSEFVTDQRWSLAYLALNPAALYDVALQRPNSAPCNEAQDVP